MKISDFDYVLPKERIARYPESQRDKCRLMVVSRRQGELRDRSFSDIIEYFEEGDLLILNDTKVIPARLYGNRSTGGRVELFIIEKKGELCEALVKPSGRLKEGERIRLDSGDEVTILGKGDVGRLIRFKGAVEDVIGRAGHMPLPPYIDREDEELDRLGYQTVYCSKEGATASPTAGLHFTMELLNKIKSRGVTIAYVTLHTNYGTFAPIKSEDVEKHKMHKERFDLSQGTADLVNKVKKAGRKVFAVGTTSARVLEYCAHQEIGRRPQTADHGPELKAENGHTDLFIYPGYEFKIVDHLITNFHLPKSTLLLLISAFAGKDTISRAYDEAVRKEYRFYSYGDAMLIL